MGDITRILADIERGDRHAAGHLLPLVYDELRKLAAARLAREAPGQSLQATALVHEAYLRLVGADPDKPFDGRGHFFAAAAEAMRRILVDRARDRNRLKRGGGRRRVRIDLDALLVEPPGDDLLGPRRGPDRPGPRGPRRRRAGEAPRLRRPDPRPGRRGARHRAPDRRPRLGLRPRLAQPRPGRARSAGGARKKIGGPWRIRATDGALKGGPGRVIPVSGSVVPPRERQVPHESR